MHCYIFFFNNTVRNTFTAKEYNIDIRTSALHIMSLKNLAYLTFIFNLLPLVIKYRVRQNKSNSNIANNNPFPPKCCDLVIHI